jgi:aminopeptidase N
MFVSWLVITIFVWCGAVLYSLGALPFLRRQRHPAVVVALVVAAGLLTARTFQEHQRAQVRQQFQQHYHAGIDERKRGNLEEAEREFREAEAVVPHSPEVKQQLQEIQQEKPAERRVQTKAVQVDPSAGAPPPAPDKPAPGKPEPDVRTGKKPKPLAHQPSPFEITHYDLVAKLDPQSHTLAAVATIRVRSRGREVPILNFSLHPECKPSAAQVDGVPARFTHPNDLLTVTPTVPLTAKGERVVIVTYRRTGKAVMGSGAGLISPDGIYFISEARWYPATGELDFRSPVSVKATVPKGYTVVSVGALKGVVKDEKTATFHWETDRLASMVSLAAGKYTQQSARVPAGAAGETLPISCYTFAVHNKRAPMFLKEAAAVVRFYARRFGSYPYEKLAVVEIPLFPGGYGTTSFVMLIDQSFDATRIDPLHREFLAHEIAHQWWGNSVFPQGMGAAWLSEAFANYSAWWYASEVAGNPRVLTKRVARATNDFFAASADRGEQSIYDSDPYQPVGARDETIYEKGAVVLHMLRLQVGDAAFKRLLRRFADRYRFGKANIEDFRREAEEEAGVPLGWFFDQWLGRKGGMALTYTFDTVPFDAAENRAVLTITQASPAYRAKMGVVLQVENSVQRHEIELSQERQEFRLPVKGKVHSVLFDPDGSYLMKPPKWVVSDSAGN